MPTPSCHVIHSLNVSLGKKKKTNNMTPFTFEANVRCLNTKCEYLKLKNKNKNLESFDPYSNHIIKDKHVF